MSRFQQLLADYLTYRSGLGFRLRKHTETLPSFVAFLDAEGFTHITSEAIVRWAKEPVGCHPNWWAERYGMARKFALYCKAILPRTEVPPEGMIRFAKHRPAPHIYSDREIKQLLSAARELSGESGLRPLTFVTLYGLLAATGLRAGEAIRLNRDDIDSRSGVLTIRATKFNKARLVPVHSSTVRALRRYATRRDELIPAVSDRNAFFLQENGRRVTYPAVYDVFHGLLRRVGLRVKGQRRGPRLHDLRHTFAVSTLVRWYRESEDVRRRLPILCTYLGHASVAWTYWYLSASPELLALAGERLGRVLGAKA